MGHDGPSQPFGFKFPFQNNYFNQIESDHKMTNQLGQQMKNNIPVKV